MGYKGIVITAEKKSHNQLTQQSYRGGGGLCIFICVFLAMLTAFNARMNHQMMYFIAEIHKYILVNHHKVYK